MTTDQALTFLIAKALDHGYTLDEVKCFQFELRERLNNMAETDEDDILKLWEEIF